MGRAWRIFWHPRRSRDELERLECELAAQTDKMSALLTRMSEMTAQNDNLVQINEQNKEKIAKYEESVLSLTSELLKTRRLLDDKTDELAQSAIDQVQLQQFMKRLDEVESLKTKYEQRIDRLRAKIIELQTVDGSKPTVLHFDNKAESGLNRISSSTGLSDAAPIKSKGENKEAGSDWLQSLPDE